MTDPRVHRARASCGFAALMAVLVAACGSVPAVDDVDLIVIDMPHGGRRIAIGVDGSGTYSYGALPIVGEFSSGTFEFREIYDILRAEAERDRRESAEEFGTVQFVVEGGSGDILYFVYDRQLLSRLLDTAFENRVEPPDVVQRDARQTLDEIWQSESRVP